MSIPQFGRLDPAARYILRPGGYVLILRANDHLAVMSTRDRLYLPGGGQELGESAEQAAIREAREEAGLEISDLTQIALADELVFAAAEYKHFRKRCTFFHAKRFRPASHPIEPDHHLLWLPRTTAAAQLYPESQRWAIGHLPMPT